MPSSRSVNHPFLRIRPRVCVIEAGNMNQDASPMSSVNRPSSKNSHCQPDQPAMPRICRIPAASREPTTLHVLRTVQNHDSRIGSSLALYQYVMYSTVSGMKPPIKRPRRQRTAKYPARFFKPAWAADMIDQQQMMKGIQISGPSFLEISPEGSSADKNDTRKMVCPVLKSFVSIPSSTSMSSVMADPID
jgi:hypothetical protein